MESPQNSGALFFTGDVFLPEPVRVNIPLKAACVVNLEYPITQRGHPHPGKVVLKADAEYLTTAFGPALRLACMANNHILDYGEDGLRDTIACLEAKGVLWFGVGLDRQSVRNPVLFEIGGTKVGLAGYVCSSATPVFATDHSPGVNPIDLCLIEKDVRIARINGATRVVVCLHWGAEEVAYPRPGDIKMAHRIVDLGADLVIGHHAHCVQPVEVFNGKHIFYELGNAIMPDLDLPSYYDANGGASRRYVKRQHRWNRRSLAVEYHPASGQVSCHGLAFERLILREVAAHVIRRLPAVDQTTHERNFQRAARWSRIQNLAYAFLDRPSVPRLQHLKTLCGMDS